MNELDIKFTSRDKYRRLLLSVTDKIYPDVENMILNFLGERETLGHYDARTVYYRVHLQHEGLVSSTKIDIRKRCVMFEIKWLRTVKDLSFRERLHVTIEYLEDMLCDHVCEECSEYLIDKLMAISYLML